MEDIKKEYSKLQKKYKLPNFEELDKNFEVSSIENAKLLHVNIRKKIAEKIQGFCEVLEGLLHPNTDLTSIYEDKFFSDKEKGKMFDLYKKLMVLARSALELSIEADEKEDAEFIKNINQEWKSIKEEFYKVANKLKESWEKETEAESKLEYLG